MAKNSIDSFIQSRWFLQGLPPSIRAELFYASDLDPDDDLELDFQELLQKTTKMIKLKKKLGGMVRSDEKNSQVSDLVDRCDQEALIGSPPNAFAPLPASTFLPPVAAANTNVVSKSEDKNVKELTEMMQSLALSVRTIQTHLGQTPVGISQSSLPNPPYQPANNLVRRSTGLSFPAGVDKCLYCWSQEHFLKRDCPAFQEDLNSNRIHLNEDKKVCLGTYLPGIRPVFMRREKPGRDCVADSEKLRYPTLPPANIQTLRIGEMDPDPYSSDEEAEYISLDEPIETGVLTARANQSKPTAGPSKEPVKRILRRRIEKEKDYAVPKNVRFGEWDPVRDDPLPGPTTTVPSTSQEAVMPDAEAIATKKTVERKRHPRVVNVLKESVGATTITKRILDLGVNLTVGELLASAPAVEKQLTKAISEDEAVQFRVNTLESGEAVETKKTRSWYSMGSPKAKVRLEDGSKVTALLDTGAEINVMTREVMEDAGLAMRRGPKLELVSHTGHSRPFLGLCEDVEVVIGGLKTRHPIFVVETGDHDLVLGQPFLNSVKFSQEYKPDGIFGTITHPYTHQSAVFRTLAPYDPANRTENQIFSQSLN